MKVNEIKKHDGKVSIFVEIDGKDWKSFVDKEVTNATKNVKIDGFRKGKVPPEKIKKHLNMQEVYLNSANVAIRETSIKIDQDKKVKELDVEVYPTPSVEIEEIDDKHLTYVLTYFETPQITIDNYKNLKVKLDIPIVTEKELERELNSLVNREKMISRKKDGKIEKGDEVVFDFTGFIDGKEFEGGKAEKFNLLIGSNRFIPGFEDGMIGLAEGEQKDINLTFPKDYHAKDFASKDVTFKVKIHEINKVTIPELNDEFAKSLKFKNVSNLKELKSYISSSIMTFKMQQSNQQNVVAINKAIFENAKYKDIPQVMIDDEADKISQQYKQQLNQMKVKEEDFLKMVNKTKEALWQEILQQAKSNVVVYGALDYIIKKEKITIADDVVKQRYNLLAQSYNRKVEDIKKNIDEETLKEILLHEKALLGVISWNTKAKKDDGAVSKDVKASSKKVASENKKETKPKTAKATKK